MKALLFGRDGQVGTALTARLPEVATEVVALGRAGADFEVEGALAAIIAREKPDVIVNAAAYTAVDKAESEQVRAMRINAGAVAELADAAKSLGALLVHYSTDYVFDGSGETRWVETDPTGPLNAYGASKLAGEAAITLSGVPHWVFRTSWVHAPGGNNFIAKILKAASERERLTVIDDQIGGPTSAALIAEVTVKALQSLDGARPLAAGIYHLQAAGETSWHGYASFAINAARLRGYPIKVAEDAIEKVPTSAFVTPAKRPLNSRLSTKKLRDGLGIDLPDWQDDVWPTLSTLLPKDAS
jgi:dTDP-4-dehydrorhamnose reductase